MAEIKGALFPRERGPRYTGIIEIGNEKYQIAVWEKTSAKGNVYLQISEDRKRDQPQQQGGGGASAYARKTPHQHNDMDDDIPF